jgi:DNA-binding NarL/FixJ family response regulator
LSESLLGGHRPRVSMGSFGHYTIAREPCKLGPERSNMLIKVAIVDDDDGVRAKLAKAVDRFDGCRCVGEFASAQDALARLAACEPEVVLMDINMPPGQSGIECVRQLKATHPHFEFIMLTVYEDTESVFNALAAGASGYLLKQATLEELLEAIQQVHAGGSPMSGHIARKVVQSFRRSTPAEGNTAKLSDREQQVLELLARGYLYKEIGDSLAIKYGTVHNHIRSVYEKLHVRSRSQAIVKYLEQNPLARGRK